VDTVLYIGTVRISDKLHNRGLERLKNGDFYHGIEALAKSVSINKNNIASRNLLGLALFEVGHIGEALKHWVISQSMLKDDNDASRYIETIHKNARLLERMNDAVEMYNKALEHIKQKSDDLAIIQLKKAVDVNPRFVDALNLLTLCYLIQNERDHAISTAERVIAIDVFNPVALNYYAILNPGKPKPPKNPKPKVSQNTAKNPYKKIGLEEKKPRNFHFAELLTFLIGVGCTVAACYFLLMPGFESMQEAERSESQRIIAEAREEFEMLAVEFESEKEAQNQNIAELNESMQELSGELRVQQRINDINQFYFSFTNNRFTDNDELKHAVEIFDEFIRDDVPHDILERMDSVLADAFTRLGTYYYDAGLADFGRGDTHMATQNLEDARHFLNDESPQWIRMLFMLGKLYFDDEKFDKAEEYLTEFVALAGANYSNMPRVTGAERTAINNMLRAFEARN
jgi:tetratricopeptide (TPR) repeat protein